MRYLFISIYLLFYVINYQSQEIKSVQLRPANSDLYTAIVPLGTTLVLSFDDLEADGKNYYYKIQHMTPNWEPSRLLSSQYIDGFQQNTIINVTNSFNTLQSYSHYEVELPNINTVITKSGNYLVSILDDDDTIVFSRRFVLYEKEVTVGVRVSRSRNAKTINTEQTLEFSINHPRIRINNPTQEIEVCIIQNDNWNTTISNLEPTFFKPNQLLYTFSNKTNFSGGNEYLNFDSKQLLNKSLNVLKIERKNIFHHYLYPHIFRAFETYTFNPDINGQFEIRTIEGRVNATEADYAAMHFSLQVENSFDDDVYVYGAFNNFEIDEYNKLTYNPLTNSYDGEIILKQGFYNYKYVTANSTKVNLDAVHGAFFQSENNYKVIAYYKPLGSLFFRAIGIGEVFYDGNR